MHFSENENYPFIQVNRKIGLSPGVHTKRLAILRDIQAKKRKAISVTKKEKFRRIQLKNRRYVIQCNMTDLSSN